MCGPSIRNLARRFWGFATSQPRTPLPPRPLSTASFQTLDPSQPIEEETLLWYDQKDYYPVQIGDVFRSRYQVVGKLGYGGYSTVWLCRDLVEHRHVALKVCTRNAIPVKRELSALKHINSLPKSKHVGRPYVRTSLDQFELTSEDPSSSQSTHQAPSPSFHCHVLQPMAATLFSLRQRCPEKMLHRHFVRAVLRRVLLALYFLHSEAKVIHADIQEKNILFRLKDTCPLEEFENGEWISPIARKVMGDRVVYLSREVTMPVKDYGEPMLCDFGEARFGRTTYSGPIQPYQYRAPEVIFGMPWDEKVDIWSVGVMIWNMLEGRNMFQVTGPDNELHNLYHLAHMVSLLGPPPVDFLKRSETEEPWKYFDTQGNWIGATSVPDDSLEQSEKNLGGEDKAQFLEFVRKMVRWVPEERSSAKELLDDEWLNKSYSGAF